MRDSHLGRLSRSDRFANVNYGSFITISLTTLYHPFVQDAANTCFLSCPTR